MTDNKRIYWLDSLKLLAALLIFTTHFLAEFAPDFLVHWQKGHILYGITGKLAVSFYFLMSGYFAMYAEKKEDVWQYVVKRYLRLAVPVLMVEIVILVLMIGLRLADVDTWLPMEMTGRYLRIENMNYRMFLSDIFLLNGKVNVSYWGNFMLFAGPVIVVILHGACAGRWINVRGGVKD